MHCFISRHADAPCYLAGFAEAMLTLLSPCSPSYLGLQKNEGLNWFNACSLPRAWADAASSGAHAGVRLRRICRGRKEIKKGMSQKGHQFRVFPSDTSHYSGMESEWVCAPEWDAERWESGAGGGASIRSCMPWKVAGEKQRGPCSQVEIYSHSEDHYCWPCLAWESQSKQRPNKSTLTSPVVLAAGAAMQLRHAGAD